LTFVNGFNALDAAPMLGDVNRKPLVPDLPFTRVHQENQSEPERTTFGLAFYGEGVVGHVE
jgi:hypothetical protein